MEKKDRGPRRAGVADGLDLVNAEMVRQRVHRRQGSATDFAAFWNFDAPQKNLVNVKQFNLNWTHGLPVGVNNEKNAKLSSIKTFSRSCFNSGQKISTNKCHPRI